MGRPRLLRRPLRARRLLPRRAQALQAPVIPARLAVTVALSDEDVPAVAARRLSGARLRARPRPRGGGRAHGGPLRRRPRLRGGPAPDGRRELAFAAARGEPERPPTSGTTSSARRHDQKERRWASTSARLRVHERRDLPGAGRHGEVREDPPGAVEAGRPADRRAHQQGRLLLAVRTRPHVRLLPGRRLVRGRPGVRSGRDLHLAYRRGPARRAAALRPGQAGGEQGRRRQGARRGRRLLRPRPGPAVEAGVPHRSRCPTAG